MAPTGSGKTLAYILPILHDLKDPEKKGYRSLIISPTRELAQQVGLWYNFKLKFLIYNMFTFNLIRYIGKLKKWALVKNLRFAC